MAQRAKIVLEHRTTLRNRELTGWRAAWVVDLGVGCTTREPAQPRTCSRIQGGSK